MDSPDFCMGFFLGFLVAGAVGFFMQRMQLARARIRQAGTRQKIVGETQLTPSEAVRRSTAAHFEILLWILAIIAAATILAWLLLS